MTDRQVRQLEPAPADEDAEQRRTFSEFADRPNIVLLGDPGAGKTHLFREFAEVVGGRFLTVRSFLNSPSSPSGETLFIDALDEKRGGRGDDDVLDRVIQKLFASPPAKVRISCRERDWLGDSDLAAFQPYFNLHGGVAVLSLQALSAAEQRAILETQGVANPDAFLNEAVQRGLEDFLANPQNLIMLAQAVRNGDWPSTYLELFETFTRLLLSEHNPERARSGAGVYGPDELRAAAGAICAVRLISDVEGISLSDQDNNPDYPSYRTIDLLAPQKIHAVLGRRVFASGNEPYTVDYVHRTTAEYLAAAWLVQRIRDGLPVGRVRSLIGIDGCPAAELRGMHAWLAVLIPEHAELFVDADPYGVLTHGDAASLTPSSRRRLLDSLSRLAQIDPWFRSGDWSVTRLGGLSGLEMADAFREVLKSSDSNFALRSLVLDAMITGEPLPALQGDLMALVMRDDAPYGERQRAFAALVASGEAGKDAIVQAYGQLGSGANAIRLRGDVLTGLYGRRPFTPSDVANLLRAALDCADELPIGGFWSLSRRIPLTDIPAIFDTFGPPDRQTQRSLSERNNVHDVAYVIDRLLLRLLQEMEEIPASSLWRWLRMRYYVHDSAVGGKSEEIGQALKQRRDLLLAVVDEATSELEINERRWGFVHDFQAAVLHTIDSDDLLIRIASHVARAEYGSEKQAFLYELALRLSYNMTPSAIGVFEALYHICEQRPDLAPIRDRLSTSQLEEWRIEQAERSARDEAEKQKRMRDIARKFEDEKSTIRSGAHLGQLAWAAQVYFGLFSDSNETAPPVGRLRQVLGHEMALMAIEGFIAVTHRTDIPSLETVARMTAQNLRYNWWYAIVAGLDELWKQNRSLSGWDRDLLRVGLAIDLACPTFEREGNAMHQAKHGWVEAAFGDYPDGARDAYFAMAQAGLECGKEFIFGLHELLTRIELAPFRREVIFRLLRSYPTASAHHLQALLQGAYAIADARAELTALAREVLSGGCPIDERTSEKWLTAAYLASPGEFRADTEARAATGPEIVWLLREMTGLRGSESERLPALSIEQLEFVAGIASQHFSSSEHPIGGWSGDRNAWDGTEFVRTLINRLSADPTEAATSALMRLEADTRLATYHDHVRHALANQRVRRREAEFRRPSWRETVATLSNGVPANVADLHEILIVNLKDISARISAANNDVYKRFWNEDSYSRVQDPKPEESCRDVLIDFLRAGLQPLGVVVEPESHMAADKRADIATFLLGQKIPIEIKRDYHSDVWNAAATQLDRFYTRDPDASGFGVYAVLWFGDRRPRAIHKAPGGLPSPRSAAVMESMLRALIPDGKRARIATIVIDVSGQVEK